MIELLGLVVAVTFGTFFVLGALVLLPIWLLFKMVGFGLKVTFGLLGLMLGGLVLLPVALVVGTVLVAKLLLLGLPLLLLALLIWAVVALAGDGGASASAVEPPPA